ncbi:MAG: glycosyltransferase [Planctomycetes bacterium]|nr:glycosyltransferase [Planctomycetota bacterium]
MSNKIAEDILGKGQRTSKWQALARRLGVDDRCRWHGWVARDQALAVVRGAHVFVITSLKDLTSTVLLEALAQGVPVICPDHCGFANVVTADCGIKLPIDSLGRFQAELAGAIARLADDEPERRRLAAGAIRRAADFSWEKKAEAVDRIYRRVLAEAAGEVDQEPVVTAAER